MMSEISATTVKKQQKSQKTFTSQTLSISFLTEYVNKTLCLKLICNNEKYVLIFKNTKNYHISLFDFHYYVMIKKQRNREHIEKGSCYYYYLFLKLVT